MRRLLTMLLVMFGAVAMNASAGAQGGRDAPKVLIFSHSTGYRHASIEAGVALGWERFVGSDGLTIGLDRFGASAPAEVLFKHFGFSAEAIVPKILNKLGK